VTNNIQEKNLTSKLNNTKWTQMIQDILQKAFDLVRNLRSNTVLIHCPNGKDASSVLSSLAQIISDPYYRTFAGFRALIYKEWIYAQHNFVKKLALIVQSSNGEEVNGQVISSEIKASQLQMKSWQNVNNSKDYTPFFIFFLDCVHQLIKMNQS